MYIFHLDNVKLEKANAMLRYNHLRLIGKLFRFCFGILFLLYVSKSLPLAGKISGQFFRQLSKIIASHLFIFLLCNTIIVTLYLNSGRISGDTIAGSNAEAELYDEFMKNSAGDRTNWQSENQNLTEKTEEIDYQDKQIISVSDVKAIDDVKGFRRTLSEKLNRECLEKDCGKLRRSETEIGRKDVSSGENLLENLGVEEELSNEEFQRTIEAFIDKQLRFRREESPAIVVHNQS